MRLMLTQPPTELELKLKLSLAKTGDWDVSPVLCLVGIIGPLVFYFPFLIPLVLSLTKHPRSESSTLGNTLAIGSTLYSCSISDMAITSLP